MILPRVLRTSIRWRLGAAFGLVVTGGVVLVGAGAIDRAVEELVASQGRFLARQAQEVLDKCDRNLFERYGDVQAFAFHPKARGTPEEATAAANFFCRAYGIYDLLAVIDADGRIVAANTVDAAGAPIATDRILGRSVAETEWFRAVVAPGFDSGTTHYTDIAVDPLLERLGFDDAVTLRFAAPVRDESGKTVRVWLNCASPERVVADIARETETTLKKAGLETAKVAIFDRNGGRVDGSEDARAARIDGSSFGSLEPDGVRFEFADSPDTGEEQLLGLARSNGALGFAGYDWRFAVSLAKSEALAVAGELERTIALIGIAVLAAALFIAYRIARGVSQPLEQMTAALETLAAGDLRARFTCVREDEVGRMGAALDAATASLRESISGIRESATAVAAAATELEASAGEMSSASDATSSEAARVSSASEQVSESIRFAAQSISEMQTAVSEISRSTSDGARCASEAAGIATTAGQAISRLAESNRAVSGVVNVIHSIAAQTNLLALNATIEAARAGESGRGFAVVADEVKDLANETAKATENITQRITAMQEETSAVLEAIQRITGAVKTVNDLQSTIASAVEEQSANSAELSRSVSAVAESATSIADGNAQVAKHAEHGRDQVSNVRKATESLSKMGETLRATVERYRT